VTEVLSIASEKVTEMLSMIETPLWLSVGEIDETVGAVVSVVVLSVVVLSVVVLSVVVLSVVVLSVVPVSEYSSLSSPQEMMVRLKQKIRKTNITFFIFSSIPKVKYYCFLY
jgi:uncharacterized membrane protein YqjE